MKQSLAKAVAELDAIDSPKGFLSKTWPKVGTDFILEARLQYVVGNYKLALKELRTAADFFSNRQGMSVQELIQREHMPLLADL